MNFRKITVSGMICSGKSTLCQNLIKKLGWDYFSPGLAFREYARKHQLNIIHADEQNKIATTQIDGQTAHYLKGKKPIIIDGWLAGIIGSKYNDVLRILLKCDDAIRFKRYAEREKVSIKEAKRLVNERYQAWLKKMKIIYPHYDFNSEIYYNCIIDTSHKTAKDVFDYVIKKLNYIDP